MVTIEQAVQVLGLCHACDTSHGRDPPCGQYHPKCDCTHLLGVEANWQQQFMQSSAPQTTQQSNIYGWYIIFSRANCESSQFLSKFRCKLYASTNHSVNNKSTLAPVEA